MNSLCWILLTGTLAYSARGEEMVVVGSTGNTKGTNVVWESVVPATRFSDPANAWDPESQTFPADLSQYCLIAKSNVMASRMWSSTPELALLHIRQVSALVNPNGASAPLLRRVVLSFHFREPGTAPALGPVKPVVMLLDGTIAEGRIRKDRPNP